MTVEKIKSLIQLDPAIIPWDGWVPVGESETWLYYGSDGNVFKVTGDYTNYLRPGIKVRWKYLTDPYGYGVIASSAYEGGLIDETTVTLIINAEHEIGSSELGSLWFSPIECPEGWPEWFTWTPSITNFTAATLTGKWKTVGRQIFWEFYSLSPTITGVPVLTLPVGMVDAPGSVTRQIVGVATFLEATVAALPGWVLRESTTTATIRAVNASATYGTLTNIAAAIPFAWGTADECNLQGNYEF